MGEVAAFPPSREAVEALWERHRSLVVATFVDHSLLVDRDHMEASARAERDFRVAFCRWAAANPTSTEAL